MTHPDHLALLAAVCAAPDDDAPRLVLADWLDIDGPPACRDAARAELIRVQVRLAPLLEEQEKCRGTLRAYGMGVQIDPLRARGGELLAAGPVALPNRLAWRFHVHPDIACEFRRGFVESVTCSAADWIQHGDALSWSPEQTDECKACGGWGNVADGWKDEEAGIISETVCIYCKAGRVPRPCPPTAQPVTEVRLTGTRWSCRYWMSRGDRSFYNGCLFRNWTDVERVMLEWITEKGEGASGLDERMLSRRWPAVKTWHLPAEPTAVTTGATLRIGGGPPIRVDNIRVVHGDDGRQTVEAETEDGRTLTFMPDQPGTEIEWTADAEVTYRDPDLWRQVVGSSPRTPRRSRLPEHLRSPSVPRRPR